MADTENPDVEMPDIPLPEPQEVHEIADEVKGAFRFAFVGSGQGGSRIAECFYKLGYRRVCVLNTAEQDLAAIALPEDRKLAIGSGGAGKNPAAAKAVFDERAEDVFDFLRKSFGPVYDRTVVCIGAGGGTGAGTVVGLVHKAQALQIANKCSSQQVGVIVALPKITEGKKPNGNAYAVLESLYSLVEAKVVSPLLVIDNERMSTLYSGLAISPFWERANSSICSLFNLFNTICQRHSSYTAFDPNDFKSVLDSGLMVFGATPVPKWQEAGAISSALRENLRKNILAGGVDLATGTVAAAVVVAGKAVLDAVPHEHLDQAFDQMTRLLQSGSTVHRGIYSADKDTMAVYTAIGGLGKPVAKLEELARLGDIQFNTKASGAVRAEP